MTDSMIDNYHDQIKRIISEHGWAIQHVGADETNPGFTYTVGLAAKGLPELIVYALKPETAAILLNDLGRRTVENGSYAHGTILNDLANFPMALIDCDERTPTFIAKNLYGNIDVQQLVYPDADGYFPWHGNYYLGIPIPIHGKAPA